MPSESPTSSRPGTLPSAPAGCGKNLQVAVEFPKEHRALRRHNASSFNAFRLQGCPELQRRALLQERCSSAPSSGALTSPDAFSRRTLCGLNASRRLLRAETSRLFRLRQVEGAVQSFGAEPRGPRLHPGVPFPAVSPGAFASRRRATSIGMRRRRGGPLLSLRPDGPEDGFLF